MKEIIVDDVRETTNNRYFCIDLDFKGKKVEVSVSVLNEEIANSFKLDNIEFLTGNLNDKEKEEATDWLYDNTEAWYE